MTDVKQWLTEGEWENYHAVCEMLKMATNRSIPDIDFLTDQKPALESLAACRALLAEAKTYIKTHGWKQDDLLKAIATALKGVGGE